MNLTGLAVGPLQANCYVLDDGATAVVVDPGGDAAAIGAVLRQRALDLAQVWLTHAHFDHVGGLAELLSAHGDVPVRMHPADAPLLTHAARSAAAWGVLIDQPPTATVDLHDEEVLTFGGRDVRCLHTPGHAPGHVAFWIPEDGVVLSGDALFRGSIGRTDLPMGDHATLLASIEERLLTLPDETDVLPGHGPATTIGREKRSNPFLG